MSRVRRETDVELGLNNIKPGDDVRVHNVINRESRLDDTGVTSPQKPPNDEFINAEGDRRGNMDVTGHTISNKKAEPNAPLAEPEPTDALSEPPTPQPARLPHRPHQLTFTDENYHDRDNNHDHGDGAEEDLLKLGNADHDEPDIGSRNGLHDVTIIDRPGSPAPTYVTTIPDVNAYQQKKNLAQGMMDLALLSANANQLRYVLESSTNHPYYYPSVALISLSIVFQVLVGIGLILNSRYNVKDESDICKADKINNMTVLGIFMITLVNVFITSFSVGAPTAGATT